MINLNDFCAPEHHSLKEPWEEEDFVYASNGNILIRVDKTLGYSGVPKNEHPNVDSLIKEDGDYQPVSASEIEATLEAILPGYHEPNTLIPCPDCRDGFIWCTCDNCGHEHQRTCERCDGEGEIKRGEISGRLTVSKATPFRNLHFQWQYLWLIADVMKEIGGEWSLLITGALEAVHFKGNRVHIVVMPMRIPKR